jgi:VCBS repeat protein
LFLALGDVNADGKADLVLGSGTTATSNVDVFSGQALIANTRTKIAKFTPASSNASTGVRVAVRDVNGDGKADILTSSGEMVTALEGGNGLPANGMPPQLFSFDPDPGLTGGVWIG